MEVEHVQLACPALLCDWTSHAVLVCMRLVCFCLLACLIFCLILACALLQARGLGFGRGPGPCKSR